MILLKQNYFQLFKFTKKLRTSLHCLSRVTLRLLRTFAGVLPCPPGKIRMHAILKESMANYTSLESLINELIGYQNSADFCEIWPEHSLDVVKQKCVGDF